MFGSPRFIWHVRLDQDRLEIYEKHILECQILCLTAIAPYGRFG